MLIRQTAPVFGAANPYQQPGETQVSFSVRQLESDTHYSGAEEQVRRHELGTYVINRQQAGDITLNHTFTTRFSMTVGVPYVSASWSIPSPTSPVPGARAQQDASGLGDISVAGRYWLLDTGAHLSGNVAIGVGLKTPTGNYRTQDRYPDRNGNDNKLRPVDQSIQPGDGGWGLMLEAQAFRRFDHLQAFASLSYLLNPKDTNGTPSGSVARLPAGATPSAAQADRLVNSVTDQYVVRAGAAVPIAKTGIAVAGAFRTEGLPRYDLLGSSHGFRRPGIALFFEPGLSFGRGSHFWSVNIPVAFYQNRRPDPYTGASGDATFPKYIVLATYGYRFGSKTVPSGTAITNP